MNIDSPFTMVVLIVAISVGAGVIKTYLKTKHLNARNVDQDKEIGELRAEVAKLTDRVKVLERLAVDSDTQLASEISRLR
jgi:cell division protein FtsL